MKTNAAFIGSLVVVNKEGNIIAFTPKDGVVEKYESKTGETSVVDNNQAKGSVS